jgi:signal transduction histidine kinase/ActR/RegA family two-component response regulator
VAVDPHAGGRYTGRPVILPEDDLKLSSVRERKLAIGLMSALVLIALIGLRSADLLRRRAQILRDGDRRAQNLALILDGYLRGAFVAADAALRQVALQSQRLGGPTASNDEWLPALQVARVGLTGVGSMSVVDATGTIRHSTQPAIVGQSRRDQFVFTSLSSDTTDRLVADLPFRIATANRAYVIPVARRIVTRAGAFDGIVVASMFPDSLRSFFRNVDVGREGSVAVFHDGGVVLFREPLDRNPIGESATGSPMFEAARRIGGTGLYRGRADMDGPVLRTAFRALPSEHFIIGVSLSEHELVAEWQRDALTSLSVAVVATLVLIALVLLLYRQMDVRHSAEQALMRAQRLESLGQLTGGVAHDFNNLLTVILGNVSLLKTMAGKSVIPAEDELLAEIERAGRRAADLTRQLLAFARRQPLMPRIVDLGQAVASAEPMLRRVAGDRAPLRVVPGTAPCLANVDPVHVETALLNLCINARDAMPDGGTLIIETGTVTLDEHYARSAGDIAPGRYSLITVNDSGGGILPEHVPRVFEPFFTTKAPGSGTGLGLSMVYGFVKQSGGHVKVYSEVGRGTSVTMYFPEATGVPAAVTPAPDDEPRGFGEVVLVVEDEPPVRALAVRLLRRLGYAALEAQDGEAAIALAESDTRIDLLLTDVILPGDLTGPRIAEAIVRRRPDLPVLFASGYSRAMIDLGAHGDSSMRFLPKPYDRRSLALAVREALTNRPVVPR